MSAQRPVKLQRLRLDRIREGEEPTRFSTYEKGIKRNRKKKKKKKNPYTQIPSFVKLVQREERDAESSSCIQQNAQLESVLGQCTSAQDLGLSISSLTVSSLWLFTDTHILSRIYIFFFLYFFILLLQFDSSSVGHDRVSRSSERKEEDNKYRRFRSWFLYGVDRQTRPFCD